MTGTPNSASSLEPLPTQSAPCSTPGATSAESPPVLDATHAEQRICDPSTFTNLSSHGDLMARYTMQLGSVARVQDDDTATTTSLSPKLGTISSSSAPGATSAESLPVLDAAHAEPRICDPSTFTNLSSHGDLMARYTRQL